MEENEVKPERSAAVEKPSGEQIESARGKADVSKARLAIKDVVTITLSMLAILLSVGTAYFNILRTEENVSVIATSPFAVIASDNILYISPGEEGQLIFINSGNRPVVISDVSLSYVQPAGRTEPECSGDIGMHFITDFESTVLKPNEVIVRKIRIRDSIRPSYLNIKATRRADGAFSFPLSHDNLSKVDILVDVCLTVRLATPSTAFHVSEFPTSRYHALLNEAAYEPYYEGDPVGRLVVLISKTGTIFSR